VRSWRAWVIWRERHESLSLRRVHSPPSATANDCLLLLNCEPNPLSTLCLRSQPKTIDASQPTADLHMLNLAQQEVLSLAIDILSQILASDQLTHTILADNTSVLLNVNGMRVLSLNETGTFLVEAIKQGMRTEEQLVAALRQEFDVDEATARRDLEQFLKALQSHLTA